MVNVLINNTEVLIHEGSTVLQACEAIGIDIPRFCYHERLSIAGNCRMCLVEIVKTPKPVASCAMPTMEGMEIMTDTPLVQKAREAVLEFLLLNHPLDCPICDQGGECDLQDQTIDFGSDRSRFFENKRSVDTNYCGPLIQMIMTRCIHCTRCVRFATEIAGVEDLGTTGRGLHTEIGTYIETIFQSELSGNVIDLCPVGALTSKPYGFLSRPWELRKIPSIDLSDAVGSHIYIYSRGYEILRILPRYNEEINEEWISDKARFAHDGLHIQRIDQPYLKRDGQLHACTWEEALLKGKEQFELFDGNQIKGRVGASVDSYSVFAFQQFFKKIGASNLSGTSDLPIDFRQNYSFSSGFQSIDQVDLCLFIGTDPRYEASTLNVRLRKRFLQKNLISGSIGAYSDLTFPCFHLGTSLNTLKEIVKGKHLFCKQLAQARNPLILFGAHAFEEKKKLLFFFNRLQNQYIPSLTIHYLPFGSNQVGQMELGIHQKLGSSEKVTYFLGGEVEEGNSFLIYQGHHQACSQVDLLLPGLAFTEQVGLYMNAEGRPQETSFVCPGPDLARDDWKIIRAFSDIIGGPTSLHLLSSKELKKAFLFACPSSSHYLLPSVSISSFSKGGFRLKNRSFRKKVLDFYKSDCITQASRIMTECSLLSQKKTSFF